MAKVRIDDLFDPSKPLPKKEKPVRKAKAFIISHSDLERIEACAYSRVFTGPREDMHSGMWFGIFIHRFLEYVTTKGRNEAVAYIARKNKRLLETVKRIKTEQIPENGIAELTLAINTSEKTCDAIDFDMAEPDVHVATRVDLLNLADDGIWEVWDYKTGNKGVEESGYEKVVAKGNVQLLTGAVAVSLMHGVDRVRGVIATIDTKSGDLVKDTALYKPKRLNKHFERLRYAHMLTLETRAEFVEEGIEPDIAPSPERCKYCRANLVCHGAELSLR